MSSGNLIDRIPVPAKSKDFPFVDASELTTIALSFNNNRVFIANGAAGISVYKHGSNTSQFSFLGAVNLDILGESSSNYILAKDNYVFVAGGKGGLKILKLIDLTNNQPTCTGNYPPYTGSTAYDLNTNQTPASYADSKVFDQNINISANFNWCGSLESRNINVNSGGVFNMTGSLVVRNTLNVNNKMFLNGTATVFKDVHINGSGELNVNGTLAIGLQVKNVRLVRIYIISQTGHFYY